MNNQKQKADAFNNLHIKGEPLILFNVWDAGSAKAVAESGAEAIATGSWSVAAAFGFTDGQQLPLSDAIANIERIVRAVDVPVTLDFEGGYADDLKDLAQNIKLVIDAGAVGINFEDQIVGGEGLYSIEQQSSRIAAVRSAANERGVPLFINARTDVFLKSTPESHKEYLGEAIDRASAYAAAGASGLFAPGLQDPELIRELCDSVTLPVNILVMPNTPTNKEMASLGVARISYGPGPYRQMIEALKVAAAAALA